MASPVLSPGEKAALDLASQTKLVEALSAYDLSAAGKWFPDAYAALEGVEACHKPNGLAPLSADDLAHYLAVASPTHCADGWSYLSRALCSYLLGDPHSAWHFAYYAELRAAQSILSALGCGAFDRWNCTLDSQGQIHDAGRHPTHVMVWLALKHLVRNNADAVDLISDATRIYGHTLPELMAYAFPGYPPANAAAGWICDWIYDLEFGTSDKKFRNRCSYNPHIVTPHGAQISECVEFVSSFWELLRPGPGAPFKALDLQVFRWAFRHMAKQWASTKAQGQPDEAAVSAEVIAAYAAVVSAAPSLAAEDIEYFVGAQYENKIIDYAKDDAESPDTPRPALARATFLLRIASGVAQNLLQAAGHSGSIDFWLNDLALRQGLFSHASEMPDSRQDFYTSCEEEVVTLQDKAATAPFDVSKAFFEYMSPRPHLLSQAERVVQWGLVP